MKRFLSIVFLVFVSLLVFGCSQAPASDTAVADSDISKTENLTADTADLSENSSLEDESVQADDSEQMSAEPQDETLLIHETFDDSASEGMVGNSKYFDGSDMVELDPSQYDLDLNEGTIAFWFKFESDLDTQTIMPMFYLGSDGSSDDMFIIEIGHSGGPNGEGSSTDPDPSNTKIYTTWMESDVSELPVLCYDSNVNLEEGKWYHYAHVTDAKGTRGYLDGVEMTNRDYNFADSSVVKFLGDISPKTKMYLGYGKTSVDVTSDMVYFKGYLDDFRLYNRALSDDEIASLATFE